MKKLTYIFALNFMFISASEIPFLWNSSPNQIGMIPQSHFPINFRQSSSSSSSSSVPNQSETDQTVERLLEQLKGGVSTKQKLTSDRNNGHSIDNSGIQDEGMKSEIVYHDSRERENDVKRTLEIVKLYRTVKMTTQTRETLAKEDMIKLALSAVDGSISDSDRVLIEQIRNNPKLKPSLDALFEKIEKSRNISGGQKEELNPKKGERIQNQKVLKKLEDVAGPIDDLDLLQVLDLILQNEELTYEKIKVVIGSILSDSDNFTANLKQNAEEIIEKLSSLRGIHNLEKSVQRIDELSKIQNHLESDLNIRSITNCIRVFFFELFNNKYPDWRNTFNSRSADEENFEITSNQSGGQSAPSEYSTEKNIDNLENLKKITQRSRWADIVDSESEENELLSSFSASYQHSEKDPNPIKESFAGSSSSETALGSDLSIIPDPIIFVPSAISMPKKKISLITEDDSDSEIELSINTDRDEKKKLLKLVESITREKNLEESAKASEAPKKKQKNKSKRKKAKQESLPPQIIITRDDEILLEEESQKNPIIEIESNAYYGQPITKERLESFFQELHLKILDVFGDIEDELFKEIIDQDKYRLFKNWLLNGQKIPDKEKMRAILIGYIDEISEEIDEKYPDSET